MSRYFALVEFLRSDTAKRHNVDNTPSFEVVSHLETLTNNLLDPIREGWGKALRVTSGYRCPRLNSLVGGTQASGHLRGDAVDIQPIGGDLDEFIQWTIEFLSKNDIPFDQLIKEKSGNARWLHLSIRSRDGKQRRQILSIEK